MSSLRLGRVAAVAVAVWLAVFLLAPIVTMISQHVDWRDVAGVLSRDSTWRLVWFSTWQAGVSVVATLTLAAPVTWLVSRYHFRGRRLLRAIGTLPFLLPSVVVATAFLAVLPRSWHYTSHAVILAHAYFNIAVVLRVVGARAEMLDDRLYSAAKTLGATPMQGFRTITWPLIRISVASAVSVVFLYCFSSFAVVRLLGGPRRSTLESDIALRALGIGDVSSAVIMAMLQVVCIAVVVLAVRLLAGDGSRIRRAGSQRTSVLPRRLRPLAAAIFGASTLFVVVPIAAIALRSVRVGDRYSLAAWSALWNDPATGFSLRDAVFSSLRTSLVAGGLGLVLAVLASYAIVRSGFAGRSLDALSVAPLAVSPVTLGLALVITFDEGWFDWRSAWWFVAIAHTLVAFPLAARVLVPAWRSIPARLHDAAAVLGAGELRRVFDVDLRLARRALIGSLGLIIAVSLGEFGAASMLSRRGGETMPVAIGRLLERTGDLVRAQAFVLASILVLVCVSALIAIEAGTGRPRRA